MGDCAGVGFAEGVECAQGAGRATVKDSLTVAARAVDERRKEKGREHLVFRVRVERVLIGCYPDRMTDALPHSSVDNETLPTARPVSAEPIGQGAPVLELASAAAAPTAANVTLQSAEFGRRWQKTPAGQRVMREITDSRAVGLAHGKTPTGTVDGVLVRHMREKTYRLVGVDFILPLDTEATETFLCNLRRGHQGGSGRTQGPRSADGKLYTLRSNVTLPMPVIEDVSRRGDGVLSLGLRKLAAQVRRRILERNEQVRDLRTITDRVNDSTGMDGPVSLVRVYLDHESIDTLRTLGGGNLSRGIRFAAWMVGKRLR